MAENSNIEWTDHTFNPWRGCMKVSDGCKNCYAETLSKRNPATLGEWGPSGKRAMAAESYWAQPLKWNREAQKAGVRRRVFCASLADVFESRVELIKPRTRLMELIHQTPFLDWLLLTKRPENIHPQLTECYMTSQTETIDWLDRWLVGDFPHNVWLGTSVENQQTADERIPHLLKVPAAVRFLSCEPLLGPVEFSNVSRRSDWVKMLGTPALSGIHWVIAGGESGNGARPMHPQWARSLRDQCVAVGVPYLFKQWGEWLPGSHVGDKFTDSQLSDIKFHLFEGDGFCGSFKVGKKAAGRVLDGRTWDEFPGDAP